MVRITIDIDGDGNVEARPAVSSDQSDAQQVPTRPPRLSDIEVDDVRDGGAAPVGDEPDEPDQNDELLEEFGDQEDGNAGAAPAG